MYSVDNGISYLILYIVLVTYSKPYGSAIFKLIYYE